ncbi:MAG: hypothetical protein AAFO88_02745, partial [Pseudomonadota bacterium]
TVADDAPLDADGLALRARAYLALERFGLAMNDVEAARSMAPDNIDILVLRGEIREAQRLSR